MHRTDELAYCITHNVSLSKMNDPKVKQAFEQYKFERAIKDPKNKKYAADFNRYAAEAVKWYKSESIENKNHVKVLLATFGVDVSHLERSMFAREIELRLLKIW